MAWMRNIHDWCISRQLWWGHRIPAWYCADGPRHGGARGARRPARRAGRRRCGRTRTSSTPGSRSALWPFSTLGWPEQTDDPRTLLPDLGHGDRARHHLLLGGPHDDDGPPLHGRRALPHRLPAPAWCATRRARRCRRPRGTSSTPSSSPRSTAPTRCASRSAALTAQGRDIKLATRPHRGLPRLRQQALERDPLRAHEPRRATGPTAARRRRPPAPPPTAGSWPACSAR